MHPLDVPSNADIIRSAISETELADALGADSAEAQPSGITILNQIAHELEHPAPPQRHRQVADQPEEEGEEYEQTDQLEPDQRNQDQNQEAQTHTSVADNTRPVVVLFLQLALGLFIGRFVTDGLGGLVVDRVGQLGRGHIPGPARQEGQGAEDGDDDHAPDQLCPRHVEVTSLGILGSVSDSARVGVEGQVLGDEVEHQRHDQPEGDEVALAALLLLVDDENQHHRQDPQDNVQCRTGVEVSVQEVHGLPPFFWLPFYGRQFSLLVYLCT
ncbi:hypothetical protein C4566_00020 [Candidatus Parcubacteria bacterium]|nr:MAG: hypothetical protein C4566_00020 [Candidatus Parcubacteria bacterium]